MLMVGIIVGAIISSSLLKQINLDAPLRATSINRLFLAVPAIVCGLAFLATVGVEISIYASRSTLVNREDSITLGKLCGC